jgi:3-deoxy-7-phosphoheptulonate synthase
MIVSLRDDADPAAVKRELTARGLWIAAEERGLGGREIHLVIAAYSSAADPAEVAKIAGVGSVSLPSPSHPRIDAQGPVVNVAGRDIGSLKGGAPALICGPCSVESKEQIEAIAARLSALGVGFLRGGAWKPRTSPYSFQGHGDTALRWMRDAADRHDLRVVTEVLSEEDVELVAEHGDLLQIGSRNMQNFALLKRVGQTKKPVLLKRAMSATIEEWLLAGEYLLHYGASGVVLCERGVRGFDQSTRNLVDLTAVALLANVHKLPIIVDPSHGTGRRDLILPLSRAAVAAGAAGVMIETHDDPGRALSDGPQALRGDELAALIGKLGEAGGRP